MNTEESSSEVVDVDDIVFQKLNELEQLKNKREQNKLRLFSRDSNELLTESTNEGPGTSIQPEMDSSLACMELEPPKEQETVRNLVVTGTDCDNDTGAYESLGMNVSESSIVHQFPDQMATRPAETDILELRASLERELERKIRSELEAEFKEKFEDEIQHFKQQHVPVTLEKEVNTQQNHISSHELQLPQTKISKIIRSSSRNGRVLTIHDDFLCLWDSSESDRFQLIGQIQVFGKINIAIFDLLNDSQIIYASKSGFVFSYNFETQVQLRSKCQTEGIISMSQSSNSLLLLTAKGEYSMINTNLVDILQPPTCIFKEFDVSATETSGNVFITAVFVINTNNILIGLATGEVYMIDFGQRKLSLLFPSNSSKLPIISIDYNPKTNNILILSIDNTVSVINISNKLINLHLDLKRLTFLIKWLDSNVFVTSNVENELLCWKIHSNHKITKHKSISLDTEELQLQGPTFFTDIQVLDGLDILLSDIKGKLHRFRL